jgi:hypothetical protein
MKVLTDGCMSCGTMAEVSSKVLMVSSWRSVKPPRRPFSGSRCTNSNEWIVYALACHRKASLNAEVLQGIAFFRIVAACKKSEKS